MIHPEEETDEIFVSNVSLGTFRVLPCATKRLGARTFDGNGREIFFDDWFPMFIHKRELPETDILALCRRIQKMEGLTYRHR